MCVEEPQPQPEPEQAEVPEAARGGSRRYGGGGASGADAMPPPVQQERASEHEGDEDEDEAASLWERKRDRTGILVRDSAVFTLPCPSPSCSLPFAWVFRSTRSTSRPARSDGPVTTTIEFSTRLSSPHLHTYS